MLVDYPSFLWRQKGDNKPPARITSNNLSLTAFRIALTLDVADPTLPNESSAVPENQRIVKANESAFPQRTDT